MELGVAIAVIIGLVIGGVLVVGFEGRKRGGSPVETPASEAIRATSQSQSKDEPRANKVLVSAEHVFFTETFASRDEALVFISNNAVKLGMADDSDALVTAFLKREAEGSTAMMDGFAIPHAKTNAVKNAGVIVVKVSEGVSAWESVDHQPVTCAIALLAPESQAGTTHIKLLSEVAQALMDEDFRRMLKAEVDPEKIAAAINARLS